MMSRKRTLFNALRNLYKDPSNEGGQGSIDRLFKAGRQAGVKGLTRKMTKEYLQTEKSYQVHKTFKQKFPRSKILTFAPFDLIEIDIVDKQSIRHYNSNYAYILMVIDTFSKFSWVEALKTKSAKETLAAFKKILARAGRYPDNIRSDQGREFDNYDFVDFVTTNGINFYMSKIGSKTKAAIVERLNRTYLSRLEKYMTQNKTWQWIKVYQKICDAYNRTYHRSIHMKPIDALKEENRSKVFSNLFPDYEKYKFENQPQPFKVGDKVRLQERISIFEKAYKQSYTDDIYVIVDIIKSFKVPRYVVKNLRTNIAEDKSYYAEQLSLVREYG